MVDNFGDEGEDNCRDMCLDIIDLEELDEKLTNLLSKIEKGEGWLNAGECYTSGKENEEVELEGGEKKLVKDLKKGDLLALDKSEKREGKACRKYVISVDEPKEGSVRYVYAKEVWGEKVLNEELCKEVFPTESGFFFGSTDYDTYYIEGMANLIVDLDRIIADHKELVANGVKDYDITYIFSSWY